MLSLFIIILPFTNIFPGVAFSCIPHFKLYDFVAIFTDPSDVITVPSGNVTGVPFHRFSRSSSALLCRFHHYTIFHFVHHHVMLVHGITAHCLVLSAILRKCGYTKNKYSREKRIVFILFFSTCSHNVCQADSFPLA